MAIVKRKTLDAQSALAEVADRILGSAAPEGLCGKLSYGLCTDSMGHIGTERARGTCTNEY